MEQWQERDSSFDEERQTIDDDDMEDSPTDTAEIWMTDRNDEDTKFVRAKGDDIPTKKYPQAASEVSMVQERKKFFEGYAQGGYGDTDFLSRRRVLVRRSARGDLEQEYSHLSRWEVVTQQAQVVGSSRSPCTHTYTYMYIYIYKYHICTYMCIYLPMLIF